ncbi:MAG: Hsp20/alpha crystallin family protein [Ammonifex sp.]|jgi:HSP20 family protein|nr:MAG: Hsp20/alpha crystallin family protein [Ammonifex sp.]
MEIRHTSVNPLTAGGATSGVSSWSVPTTISPRVDIIDTGDAVVYLMDLAGVDSDRLFLEISPKEVAVTGQLSGKIPQGALLYGERSRGAYARVLALPRDLDSEHATADMNNGLLMVRFPKNNNRTT